MLDDDSPGLGVDFIIDAGDSFAELARLSAVMDSTEAKVLADAKRIEQATGSMVNMAGATASVKAFAGSATVNLQQTEAAIGEVAKAKTALDQALGRSVNMSAVGPAATREAAATAREIKATEKAIDQMVFALTRETAAIGLTKEQLRDKRIETLALTAAEQKNTDAADRLLTATRALSAARQAQAEDRHAAEMRAEAAAARDLEIAEAAIVTQLRERARLEAALARTTGGDRPRATDAGATFSALAAQAAEEEARATTMAATAAKQAADEHARLATLVRASQAAQEADAAAAEQLRASTDPLYSALKRVNAEIAESTRLYHAGATPPAEYARQQQVLAERLVTTSRAHDEMALATRRNGFATQQLAIQMPDIVQGLLTGQKPMTVFIQQGGQLVQLAMMAEGGIKGFGKEIGSLALRFLPLGAAVAVAGVAIYRWKEQINDDAGLKKYAAGLGLTHAEMKKLGDVSVTTGDLMAGAWKTLQDGLGLAGSGKKLIDYLFSPSDAQQLAGFVASIYGAFVGGYKGIVAVWGLLPGAMSDLFVQAVNASADAIESLVNKAIGAVNSLARGANTVLKAAGLDEVFGQIGTVGVPRMVNNFAGAGKKAGAALGENIQAETKKAMGFMTGIADSIAKNATDHAQARLKKKADEIIADRTPKKPKVDRHAESLARDAEAVEAQIKNLYALADAYGVSGSAALIAEDRVKAESKAIRQQADIEAAVSRQVQLAIAQRVADAAKSTATARDQAAAQEQVNAMVAAGNVPSERAAELVKDQLADLPLLAALQAAQQRGLGAEAAQATKALNEQRGARERLNAAEEQRQFNADKASGDNQLATLREELRLVGATDAARVHALATLKTAQEAEAKYKDPARQAEYVAQQVAIADAQQALTAKQDNYNASLTDTADKWDLIARNVQTAGQGMADAFGNAGRAIGDMATIYAGFQADRARLDAQHAADLAKADKNQQAIDRANTKFALASSTAQIGAFGDMATAAKGFFGEKSKGYAAMQTAEKAFRAIEFALSVRAMAQDAAETASSIAKTVARTAVSGTEAVVNAIKSLPFPLNLVAGAATAAAIASLGVSIVGSLGGGSTNTLPKANDGTGTVLGDSSAKSDSIKNSIDALKEVDLLTNSYSRQMAASLRSIESQIGGVASLIARAGNVDASGGVTEGFKTNAIGSILSKIPLIGGILGSLFGTKTTVLASGLYGGAQSVGSIINGGFDASYYSDIEKKKKFLGITTSTKTSTQYSAADSGLENQFTLILKQFDAAILAAAGPLGVATSDVQAKLNSFVVNIGKIDLKGLTGDQIQEKLEAVFGAAADGMAAAAFPAIAEFQKVGEGLFETLVRVSSTVEAVGTSLDMLGTSAQNMSIGVKLGLADQFDSVSDLTSAADAYFQAYYTSAEQAAAKTTQFSKVFASLGLQMPDTLAGFRQLVEAQNLNTAAGQAAYATLLQLAPAFADLQASMAGAKSAADITSERQDLERQLLELRGDTAAIRALDLAKLDASNRAVQQQIWAIQDAQDAAKAADELRQAWTSVGDSIMDEVKRIRGLTDAGGGNSFATLQGQFNAATASARAGDQDAAKSLPALSQALLTAAADQATSRQELARVQAQTAASLEATYGVVSALAGAAAAPKSTYAVLAAASVSQGAATSAPANDDLIGQIKSLREEVAGMRSDNNSGHAATAGNTGRIDRRLQDVTAAGNGEAISVTGVAA